MSAGTAAPSRTPKPVTIGEVARRAGVSKTTVSKHLNDVPYVSEQAAARIDAAIAELDFQPNRLARSLVTNRTGSLAVVIPSITNPFYPDLVAAIDTEASKRGYDLILVSTGGDAGREAALVDNLHRKRVDGILFASARVDDSELNRLVARGEKIVMVSRHVEGVAADFVVPDNHAGAVMATEHLIRLGHHAIGYLGGPTTVVAFRDRLRGYLDTMRKHGLSVDPRWLVITESGTDAGFRGALQLFHVGERPTALFVGSDAMALGVLEGAQTSGWVIPDHLALVGFDNISFARVAAVPLTTVDGRTAELGRIAVQLLVDRIEGQTLGSIQQITLPPALIVRRSCGS
ncbi:MAG: transcriptional regulator, LacI family [Thermomicrobiales bacterium]|nr:transcriptional regulator, LacI family [Thermomicrobiales bacterium]